MTNIIGQFIKFRSLVALRAITFGGAPVVPADFTVVFGEKQT